MCNSGFKVKLSTFRGQLHIFLPFFPRCYFRWRQIHVIAAAVFREPKNRQILRFFTKKIALGSERHTMSRVYAVIVFSFVEICLPTFFNKSYNASAKEMSWLLLS